MSIDHILVLFSVLIAFLAWEFKRSYFITVLILVADFSFFFGIDEIWINTEYWNIDLDMMLILKGFAYLGFFYLYLITGSFYLAILSTWAGFYHFSTPYLGIEGYSVIMTVYCIMQLLGAFAGVFHDLLNRINPHWFSGFYHLHSHKHKGKGNK